MRVQQLTEGPAHDRGAIAVVVAICTVLLFGMAAFAVDFGNAFANKRQLSVSADASALAAARAVNNNIPVGGSCNAAALQPTAQSAAETANAQNDRTSDSVVTSVEVACIGGSVEVTVKNQRSVPSFFGGIFGANGYTPTGTATAQLFVPEAVSGLRPIAACESTVTTNYQPAASPPVSEPFLAIIDKADAVCGTPTPGQWGFTNFLDQGGFGDFEDPTSGAYNSDPAVCDTDPDQPPVGPVPGSPVAGGAANCQASWTDFGYGGPVWFPNSSTSGDTGLSGNTGISGSGAWRDAYSRLPDDVILLPVATAFEDPPGPGGGRLDVTGVVTVRVCSVMWKGEVFLGTAPECSAERTPGPGPDLVTWTEASTTGALWVMPLTYVTSGVAGPRPGCAIGQAGCDFGTRAVRLYR